MKAYVKHIICFVAIIAFFSCQRSELQKLSLEEQLESRYQQTIKLGVEHCKMRAIDAAEIKVDSFIDRLLKKDLIDTLDFPSKPVRPDRPEDIN